MAENNREVLLKVENLCQYFGPTKAVDDVSFDIYKGEVFGLVGESGCGKTTTGRSIIKIYDITSGSIYFKGQRICAGTKSYRDEIKAQREKIKELSKTKPADAEEQIAACKARIASKFRSRCMSSYTINLQFIISFILFKRILDVIGFKCCFHYIQLAAVLCQFYTHVIADHIGCSTTADFQNLFRCSTERCRNHPFFTECSREVGIWCKAIIHMPFFVDIVSQTL